MNAHEVLRFRLVFAGSLDLPSMIFERSLIEEHVRSLHDHAVAPAQLVECRRSMARHARRPDGAARCRRDAGQRRGGLV